jgi:hypothetical protein
MKVILHLKDDPYDLVTQAIVARRAVQQHPDAEPGTVMGVLLEGDLSYAVRWNKKSITIYPQQ